MDMFTSQTTAKAAQRPHILATFLIITALVTAMYWLDYFTSGEVKTISARWYTAFEDAFPVADGWMAVCCLLAGLGYARGARWATSAGLLAASALLYLAAMDITFDAENHLYASVATLPAMQFELAINLWSLGLGIWTAIFSWQRQNPAQPSSLNSSTLS